MTLGENCSSGFTCSVGAGGREIRSRAAAHHGFVGACRYNPDLDGKGTGQLTVNEKAIVGAEHRLFRVAAGQHPTSCSWHFF